MPVSLVIDPNQGLRSGLEQELAERIDQKVREAVTERILREARLDEQVAAAVAVIETPDRCAART
jgi:hypothetical protein